MENPRFGFEEARKITENTTKEQLSILADLMNKKESIDIPDDNVPINHSDSDTSSDTDDEILPIEKKRKQTAKKTTVLNASDRIYQDNQVLWSKLSKLTAISEKTEERLHFIQLDLNTKYVECEKQINEIKLLKLTNITQQDEIKSLTYSYNTTRIYTYMLFYTNVCSFLYIYADINVFFIIYDGLYIIKRYLWTIYGFDN
uniref:Uncharacterized protein n=1 Tax=viral metagenome TaxID=1070528 RepID=A0A6C0F828_9ZZZZ|tara:strand:- start:167 stop:769 length:603 start_codon:yes stop_codon:yes gene_type:complete